MAAIHHHQPQTLKEARTLWIGDLQIWVDENYLRSYSLQTYEVIIQNQTLKNNNKYIQTQKHGKKRIQKPFKNNRLGGRFCACFITTYMILLVLSFWVLVFNDFVLANSNISSMHLQPKPVPSHSLEKLAL